MKTKKMALISILFVFIIVAILVCVSMFSLKKNEVVYAVSDEYESEAVQEVLDGYLGKNLVFLDVEKIKEELSIFTYIEVVSIKKDYPNVLKVELKERREIYYLENGDRIYVLTDDGYVINSYDKATFTYSNLRDKIILKLSGVNPSLVTVGQKLKTDKSELLDTVFEMAKSVDLTDCIKEISLINAPEKKWAIFSTYTGVDMRIIDIDKHGIEKIEKAFSVYDAQANDFEKTFNVIEVIEDVNGNMVATWKTSDVILEESTPEQSGQ